jgi:type II secretory pathway component GspD/PulD (secretin)
MKFLILILILSILFISSVSAEVLKKDGNDFIVVKPVFKMSEILSDYVKLEKLSMSLDRDFTDSAFTHQGTHIIHHEKIEKYISNLLNQSGNSIIRSPGTNYLRIVSDRNIRYATLPLYKEISEIPENANYIQFSYQLKHVHAYELSNNLRPFIGRYGRVIDVSNSEAVIIADTATNILRLSKLIPEIDTEAFAKSRKEITDINEKNKKIISKEKGVYSIFTENQGVFLVIFLFLGLIIGFGSRSYMLKRIEGGW